MAFVGAIGQPDAHAGELPCAYVELVKGRTAATSTSCWTLPASHIHERAAVPKHIEILAELPKTAVGKVFKPDLRRLAITRVYDAALAEAGRRARVVEVVEDKKRGLVAQVARGGSVDEAAVTEGAGRVHHGLGLGRRDRQSAASVHPDRDRPVVDEADRHVGAESAVGRRDAFGPRSAR